MQEMPLVLFTVFSQLAAGGVVTLWLLDRAGRIKPATGKFLSGSLMVITALSLALSFLHLGHPLYAFRALTNLSSSWLSREAALFTIFLVMLLFYYRQWDKASANNRKNMGIITASFALLAVLSSGMVYTLPAVPAWNNFSPLFFFLLTAALLGPMYVGVMTVLKEGEIFNLSIYSSLVIGIYAVGFLLYLSVLLSGGLVQYLTGVRIIGSFAFWLHALLSWLIPLVIFSIFLYRKRKLSFNYLAAAFFLTLAGEILGRGLFYSTAVHLQVGAF